MIDNELVCVLSRKPCKTNEMISCLCNSRWIDLNLYVIEYMRILLLPVGIFNTQPWRKIISRSLFSNDFACSNWMHIFKPQPWSSEDFPCNDFRTLRLYSMRKTLNTDKMNLSPSWPSRKKEIRMVRKREWRKEYQKNRLYFGNFNRLDRVKIQTISSCFWFCLFFFHVYLILPLFQPRRISSDHCSQIIHLFQFIASDSSICHWDSRESKIRL